MIRPLLKPSEAKNGTTGPAEKFPASLLLAGFLALFSFGTILAFNHYADGDLWAKMALGASVWDHGDIFRSDMFAFTPTLPHYIEHEWGAGLVFFTLLKWFGPVALMLLKAGLCLGTLAVAMVAARRVKTSWPVLLLLCAPAFFCVLAGYILVVRSYAFTYFFFAVTLLCLEEMRRGRRWPVAALVLVIWLWANVHGGFVVGLGMMGIYALIAFWQRGPWLILGFTIVAAMTATLVNPYGFGYWEYLLPAVFKARPFISEWRPLPFWPMDDYVGFRILFLLAVVAVPLGWGHVRRTKSWSGLAVMLITALAAWHSRRHAPFFGVAALVFLGPYLEEAFLRCIKKTVHDAVSVRWLNGTVVLVYAVMAGVVALKLLPQASFQVLAPVGAFPVREADILKQAGATGNAVVPFDWGCYLSWRLYPQVKVSIDGRYETTYPESTFRENLDFNYKLGTNWDRLLRNYPVDFIILDLKHGKVRPEELQAYGFAPVWTDHEYSALLASTNQLPALEKAVAELPPTTIEPLDPNIPAHWWDK